MANSDEVEYLTQLSGADRFFELSVDLLVIAGYDGYFKRINPAWGDVLGWSREELLSRPYLDFVHPDDRSRTVDEADAIRLHGRDCLLFENRYRCKDETFKWLHWKARPFASEGLIYGIARDITLEKELEIALLKATSDFELSEMLPVCAWCKKVRDEGGSWVEIEVFIARKTKAQFTHGICPSCQGGLKASG